MIAIIVTHNSERHIGACLASLDGQQAIVIDNASADGTVEVVRRRFPDVAVVAMGSNVGLAAAVNIGLDRAGRDDALILNPDVVIGPGALDRLGAYLRLHPSVGIVAPLLVNPDGTTQDSVRRFPTPLSMAARRTPLGRTPLGRRILDSHLLRDDHRRGGGPVDWALGAALLVRREAIDQVGGMDQRFFLYAEDTDLCFRMWEAGWQVHCCPDAVMTHAYARSSQRTLDLANPATRHHWRSIIRLFAAHPTLLTGTTWMSPTTTPPPVAATGTAWAQPRAS